MGVRLKRFLVVKVCLHKHVTSSFDVHHFDILGVPNDKPNFKLIGRSLCDVPKLSFVFNSDFGWVDLYPHLNNTL